MLRLLVCLPALLAPSAGAARPGETIAPELLKRHVESLASDELAGRRSGSPELRLAADYVARALSEAGVHAGGAEGSYFQEIALVSYEHEEPPLLGVERAAGPLEPQYGRDYDLSIQGDPRSTGSLRVLVVRAQSELPAEADPGLALALDTTRNSARDWLSASGHADGDGFGLLLLPGRDDLRERDARPPRAGGLHVERDDRPDWITAHGELKRALFAGEITGLELRYHATLQRILEPNVLGLIPARPDSEVREEALVLSAHIDHIGVAREPATPAADGAAVDLIRNGADDDASGVALLLAIAGPLAKGPPPERTIVLLFATGEEVGLWGTYYYLDHPVVPLERTVLNLNFEMLGRPDPLVGGSGRMWLTGYERSNLGPLLGEAGLPVVLDPRPEQSFFTRSDNIAFVQRGIVGQTLSTYNLHTDYHGVDDEADRIDYEHMARCAEASLEAVRRACAAQYHPLWNEGEPNLRRR